MYQEIHHTLKLSNSNQYEQKTNAKICTCNKCHNNTHDICFYVPFCTIFVALGVIQIVSGIFYFLTIPVIKLIFNVAIGCWAILCGISGSMVACVCPSTPRKHEFLLYCSLSILILNIVNLILLEIGQVREIFNEHLQKALSKEYHLLESENGRFITTYTAILLILVTFLEVQINFCYLSRSQMKYKKEKNSRKSRRPQQYIDTDQNADLEYVIPKKVETNGSRKPSMDTTVQVYAKSWVFEGTGEEAYQPGDSPSICSSNSPTRAGASTSKNENKKNGHSSKLSDATSERFNTQMSSFSRCATPSPIPNSGQATPTNAIYADYLNPNHNARPHKTVNHLRVDYIQTEDLLIGATVVTPTLVATSSSVATPKYTTKTQIQQNSNGPSSISSQQDDSQYASMLVELEQSLIEKKIQATNNNNNNNMNNMSPDDTSLTASTDKFGSSKSSSKDGFSRELSAALQLIQDLETPSEGVDGNDGGTHLSATVAKVARSESEKTLSAAISSLPSPEQPPYKQQTPEAQTPQNGKQDMQHVIEPSSQSTSGYSSPNSFSSNVRLSHASSGISNNIHEYSGDQSNVVRIYIEQNSPCTTPTPSSTIYDDQIQSNLTKDLIGNETSRIKMIANERQSTDDSLNKPYILFKKRSKLMPHSDFQNRIFKSECLAYLSDEELVARHKCNRDVIRKIEQSVAQKIRGSPRYSEYT
ncbi:ras guanine nucleotide exchange factor Q-like [Contarinia nasturtii]|uniref:ras guanine nucleotide exchange factor Q-like n=1 Tax=Contarinia nasturtii TaxID=265458 RepID=UPI0012D4BC66|nr:ras guanine nucleotide exchange factor Q-like [Contarinia nasturtii]